MAGMQKMIEKTRDEIKLQAADKKAKDQWARAYNASKGAVRASQQAETAKRDAMKRGMAERQAERQSVDTVLRNAFRNNRKQEQTNNLSPKNRQKK